MSSLWFLFAELFEARIVPERIEHWIKPNAALRVTDDVDEQDVSDLKFHF